ncbi:hypothetical protein [Saccharothrix xinjiangensis]|uniref:Uncharacterized protein n=1 Tax=Saccharothrix xinjiangensis TaxID=204798 RepID=A0ABV9Y0W2_9PSEU
MVLKAVAYFHYQSCEHPGWHDSEAHELMSALRTAILDRHPDFGERVAGPFGETHRYATLPSYHRAPWGIEQLEQAVSVPA